MIFHSAFKEVLKIALVRENCFPNLQKKIYLNLSVLQEQVERVQLFQAASALLPHSVI